MSMNTLEWKHGPNPPVPGEPVATSQYNLPDPGIRNLKNLVKIAISDATGMQNSQGNAFRVTFTYAHREGGRVEFHPTLEQAKRSAEELMEDLTREARENTGG